ncbi:hypothetical protein BU23DRAFT_557059 [Bimuria novae-zelandiae CBS 107.79]|uniref:Inhibitor I9 domain-containing protein n=1 Tax=Bimuria novae-zelandiae CBS 107.79 TaxID=1447943 RepID=A0A6A5V1Q0_9PLEO|nr:hypothetical protein BU23DRAFT_557059 [Bimuria novae-zelandiae CBS 107.79]
MAVAPTFHNVIISFPKDAPGQLLEDAKEKVRNTAGAKITHEYTIINAFAASVPDTMFSDLQALSTKYPPVIEGDGIVTTQATKPGGAQVGI